MSTTAGRNRRPSRLLPDGATGTRAQPAIRIFGRWARGPLLPVTRLWRRNIQLRVVATTLVLSFVVVLVLGVVVIGQVRNGLLEAKRQTAQSQADGGFTVAADEAVVMDDLVDGQAVDPGVWLTGLVQQLASGGQSVYSVVALPSERASATVGDGAEGAPRGPRASRDVRPEESIPAELREAVDADLAAHRQYGTIVRPDGSTEPGLVIGKRLNDNHGNQYQLYYLFPFSQEEESLSLVRGTIATAGVFLVVLFGSIAWLVVRQVVTPVRMAARIAERLAAGRLQERMKVSGEDDIARLGESFNKMARNLQVKIQQLEELSRMQRRFVSDVSHELRTPLTTVRMAADVIHTAREDFDPVTARSAELLLDQLDRFESLLADLLEISRFDAGAASLEAEPTDLRTVVRRVVEGAAPLADRKGSRLLVRGDERPVTAEVDPRRVERVVRNLVANAIEHGEGRDVVVRMAASGDDSGPVAIAVRDYGIGLSPEEADRVFNRFWRADPARARTTGGTGLGLSIAVEDTELHGGALEAWGEPGGGAQFRLTLPRTVGARLRRSPLPLEPADSRAARGARGSRTRTADHGAAGTAAGSVAGSASSAAVDAASPAADGDGPTGAAPDGDGPAAGDAPGGTASGGDDGRQGDAGGAGPEGETDRTRSGHRGSGHGH